MCIIFQPGPGTVGHTGEYLAQALWITLGNRIVTHSIVEYWCGTLFLFVNDLMMIIIIVLVLVL